MAGLFLRRLLRILLTRRLRLLLPFGIPLVVCAHTVRNTIACIVAKRLFAWRSQQQTLTNELCSIVWRLLAPGARGHEPSMLGSCEPQSGWPVVAHGHVATEQRLSLRLIAASCSNAKRLLVVAKRPWPSAAQRRRPAAPAPTTQASLPSPGALPPGSARPMPAASSSTQQRRRCQLLLSFRWVSHRRLELPALCARSIPMCALAAP